MLAAPILIETSGPSIIVVSVGSGADIVLVVAGAWLGWAAWWGIKTQIDLGERIEARLRNPVSGERIAHNTAVWREPSRQGIKDLDRAALIDQTLGKIALPLEISWNSRGHCVAALAVPGAFIIQEEKGAVATFVNLWNRHRAADREAEDIIMEHTLLL